MKITYKKNVSSSNRSLWCVDACCLKCSYCSYIIHFARILVWATTFTVLKRYQSLLLESLTVVHVWHQNFRISGLAKTGTFPSCCTQSYYIYSNARWGFSSKFGAWLYEFVINSYMRCQTGPCGVKPWPAAPNHHGRYLLYWDVLQCRVLIPCRHFRTTCRSNLLWSRNPKDGKEYTWS